MASVNPMGGFYSSLTAKNKGIGGLVTGLDTEQMIEAMTLGMRTRITKQTQQKQLALWKQDAYRSAVTALSAFRDKWFTSTGTKSSQNILMSSFFSTYKATTASNKVNVTPGTNASTGDIKIISIDKLATAHTITSSGAIAAELKSYKAIDPSMSFKGETLNLNVDGSVYNIKLDELDANIQSALAHAGGSMTVKDAFNAEIQKLVDAAVGKKGVTETNTGTSIVNVSLDDSGKLNITSDSGKVSVAVSNKALGLNAGDSNRISVNETTLGQLSGLGGQLSGDTYRFNINGVEITAKATDTVSALMSKINSSAANVRMSYSTITGKFEMTSKVTGTSGKIDMYDVQGNLMNQLFGAATASSFSMDVSSVDFSNKSSISLGSMGADFELLDGATYEFNVTVNGVQKNINYTVDSSEEGFGDIEDHAAYLMEKLNDKIYESFKGIAAFDTAESGRKMLVSFEMDKSQLKLATDPSLDVSIATVSGSADYLVLNGGSNQIANSLYIKLGDAPDDSFELADGDVYSFKVTINGEERTISFTVDENEEGFDEIEDHAEYLLGKLNDKLQAEFADEEGIDAGSVSFVKTGDEIRLNISASFDVEVSDVTTPGITGLTGGTNVNSPTDYITLGSDPGDSFRLAAGTTYAYEITVGSGDDATTISVSYTATEADIAGIAGNHTDFLLGKLNGELTAALAGEADIADDAALFEKNAEGKIQLKLADSSLEVSVAVTPGNVNSVALAGEGSNISSTAESTTLAQIGITGSGTVTINGTAFTYGAGDTDEVKTVSDLLDKLNGIGDVFAKIENGKLIVAGGDGLSVSGTGDMLTKLFGLTDIHKTGDVYSYTAQPASTSSANEILPQNAEITVIINGKEETLTSNSNNFDIGGTNVEVLDTSAASEGPINISVASDPDALIKKLEDFITDYNALIATLNGMVREEANADYQPLTDEQKAEMSKDEIDRWEAEAKKGILRNDSTINGILDQLRRTLYGGKDSEYSLYNIGITTVSVVSNGTTDVSRNGFLEITADNMERLRDIIINDPDYVRKAFTSLEEGNEGIGVLIDNAIDRAVNSSSDPKKRGSLISIAGTGGKLTGDNTSTLGNRIKAYDDAIARLQAQLEKQYNSYWKKFSALETAIQRLNMQSSWLADFGTT